MTSRRRGAWPRALLGPAVLAAALAAPGHAAPPSPGRAAGGGDTVWEPLKVGAGGWITGIDACTAGRTFAIRTDTYGGYVGGPSDGAGAWRQVIRADTMPPSFVARMGDYQGEGIYELRVAPSDCSRLYMAFKKRIYRSSDRAATWTETAFSYAGPMDPNDDHRIWGEKMAVDPANPDVVYVGTVGAGLHVTTDGGATWRAVPGVPVATHHAGVTGIAFDPTGGTIAGRTRTIYACSNGHGVHRSTDGGASWSLLPGGPRAVVHASVAADGVYYAVDRGPALHRFAGSGQAGLPAGWSTAAPGPAAWHSVATDPFDAARVVVGDDGGYLDVTTSRGRTWAGRLYAHARTATDVPWLAFANETYMSNGSMRFDPVVRDRLWFAQGIGVWYSTDPGNRTRTVWRSHSAGIEQLVARDVCVPPGGRSVVTAGMDRSVFVLPRANASYPSRYGTEPTPSKALVAAWAVAYAADDPSHLVAIVNRGLMNEPELSGYSLDGGETWTRFPVQPGSGGQSGDVVAPSIDSVIAVIGTRYAYRSTDRGRSWSKLSLPGDGGGDTVNLHGGYNHKRHVLAVDGGDRHTVYLYFYTRGLYRSTDDGATWSLVSTHRFDGSDMFWQAKLRAVPGRAGHLFLTAGQAGGGGDPNPKGTHLWRSVDGGASWSAAPGMAEPYDVAVGKAAPGAGYPTIYVVGWYRGQYGIWRSTDDGSTWTNIGPFPFGSLDEINVIAASQDTYGEVYVAFQGSGWGRGRLRTP